MLGKLYRFFGPRKEAVKSHWAASEMQDSARTLVPDRTGFKGVTVDELRFEYLTALDGLRYKNPDLRRREANKLWNRYQLALGLAKGTYSLNDSEKDFALAEEQLSKIDREELEFVDTTLCPYELGLGQEDQSDADIRSGITTARKWNAQDRKRAREREVYSIGRPVTTIKNVIQDVRDWFHNSVSPFEEFSQTPGGIRYWVGQREAAIKAAEQRLSRSKDLVGV